jgi:hypothetical protein
MSVVLTGVCVAKRRDFRKEPTLRATHIVYLMCLGARLTTTAIARLTGMSYWGARSMMEVMESSHEVPVTCINGEWLIVATWNSSRRDWFDTSKLTVAELQQLIALTLKMMGNVEVTSTEP